MKTAIEQATSGHLCWTPPGGFDRVKLGLVKGDIAAAVAWFTEKVGQPPVVIVLHPKNGHLAGEVPPGIAVEYTGALAWEVQLSATATPEPVVRGPFNICRDMEIVRAGGFFCQGCLTGKPAVDQSPDGRYCRACFDLLSREFEMRKARGVSTRPDWVPVGAGVTTAEDNPPKPRKRPVSLEASRRQSVAKIQNEENQPKELCNAVATRRGRPRVHGVVCRQTQWRRRRTDAKLQGAML